MTAPFRTRLPNRRLTETRTLIVGRMTFTASVGFDNCGCPREMFLSGGKSGSDMDALLGDAALVVSIALQHGIRGSALAKSIARIPAIFDGAPTLAASPIGLALDLIAELESEPS